MPKHLCTHTLLYILVEWQHCIHVCRWTGSSSRGGPFLRLAQLLRCMDPVLYLNSRMRHLDPALGEALCLMSLFSHSAACLDLALVHGKVSPLVNEVSSSSDQHKEEKHLYIA